MASSSIIDMAELIQQASADQKPVYAIGGGTQQHQLAEISIPGITIHTTQADLMIDYPYRDMTITVEAGMTIESLQRILASKGQTLPMDVPSPEVATIGGSMAANICGPRRLGHGTWRDYVLGIEWLNDQGQLTKAGGKVVKNVAGYDLCKLFCGSFGTLGVITQLTLKVKPIPEKQIMASWEIKEMDCLAERLRCLPLRPIAVFVNHGLDAENRDPQINVILEDNQKAISWSIDQLCKAFLDHKEIKVTEMNGYVQIINTHLKLDSDSHFIHVRAKFPVSKSDLVFRQIQNSLRNSESWIFQPLLGTLEIIYSIHEQQRACLVVQELRQVISKYQGYVQIPKLPPAWRKSLLPWGPSRPDWNLMRQVKKALDPKNIFQRYRCEILDESP